MSKDSSGEEATTVDAVAREQIATLRRRLEGAHLVPGYGTIFRQTTKTILGWAGWDLVGISSGVLACFAGVLIITISTVQSCSAHEQAQHHAETEQFRNQFEPVCETMGLTFVAAQSIRVVGAGVPSTRRSTDNGASIIEHVVCAGEDRIVTINARNIYETEVFFIPRNEE